MEITVPSTTTLNRTLATNMTLKIWLKKSSADYQKNGPMTQPPFLSLYLPPRKKSYRFEI